eukprot:COSAG01_NODE_48422_length_381_cov_1.088652_1_plen_33_part_10
MARRHACAVVPERAFKAAELEARRAVIVQPKPR